ncbi:MAG: DUF4834 domain-containing protein [Alistipes sp.]|nr:DUF4834 domain-containing protein [Alistipes sp.]MDE5691345.1 DUF4834 domain-containing protein [Alistipes sp.]MDE5695758.1 DUF4834 domain-containing protein [Alistipes sp.]MDE6507212.1 DUF4834 domain-containing protein [Alistipes sp.]MDE7078344.1 DUF4834 domain-containing protein [Alistipes sp.]
MKFLAAILDALTAFVQRNPLFVLSVVVLALVAPALLKGVAAFILYLFLGFVLFVGVLVLLLRWRIWRVQRDMERQFRAGGPGYSDGSPFAGRQRRGREGDVRVHKTAGTPEKRVASDVGDYVEFEETKEK